MRATMAATPTAVSGDDLDLTYDSPRGRWVVAATVLGSAMASIDATVVGIALPAIGRDFDTGLAALQWVVTAYTLTLAGLLLVGGALGDRYGRRRIFLIGVIWFAVASLLCGIAPTAGVLIAARALQGVGAALLTPGSLAIIEASFVPGDRGKAIGAWSGLSGVASAIGPFLGGWLVDAASWRWIFLINVPLAVFVVVVTARHVPESFDPHAGHHVDLPGAGLIALALGRGSWGLIGAGSKGWSAPTVWGALVVGVASFVAFVVVERRSPQPMVPPSLFASAQFRAANLVTAAVYAGLGGVFFLLVMQLQNVLGYSAIEAGAATLPITALMLTLSARSGALAARIGPRLQMTAGPLLVAVGALLLTRVVAGATYVGAVLPAVLVIGLGLATAVAPLTATAMSSAEDRYAGVASGVNTTVARAAQLVAVAALPVAAGITGAAFADPAAFSDGFQTAMVITAGLAVLGSLSAFVGIRNPAKVPEAAPLPVPSGFFCGAEGTPLETCPGSSAGQRAA